MCGCRLTWRFPLHEKCRVYVCQKLGRVRRKPNAPVLLSPSPRKATPSCMRLTRTFSGVRVVEHPFPPCSCAENDSIFLNTSVLHFGFFYQFSQTWQEDLLGTLSTSLLDPCLKHPPDLSLHLL
ncbi:hypothetical protein PVAP13_3KG279200 [Panicum virgatum]|uniref:Uncharacterized protein n=1 Tax=Panicum virgatum TaxID=38727 RepID=A0A8T0V198_PANVG|nr:hypothetical protein PVAP13_3KG279200 [Panicum virgatum]KAG2626009.1 hypothetical protein PVAP13_3KG279200 [Panicum virgatum]